MYQFYGNCICFRFPVKTGAGEWTFEPFIFVTLLFVKSLLLILSLLLSLFTGGKDKADAAAVAAAETTFRVAEATSSGTEACK